MDGPDIARLEEVLGVKFADISLLKTALVHAGAAADRRSNERMEFLGDRVLGLIVADLLYARFPDEPEGALARRQADLVSRHTLAGVAQKIDLGAFMTVASGDQAVRQNPANLADCCEALICALYLDGGLAPAKAFVTRHWAGLIEDMLIPPMDSKTRLQEWAQGRGLALPSYTPIGRSGPDHAPEFTVEVEVETLGVARGEGRSKRVAEQNAAAALLQELDS